MTRTFCTVEMMPGDDTMGTVRYTNTVKHMGGFITHWGGIWALFGGNIPFVLHDI